MNTKPITTYIETTKRQLALLDRCIKIEADPVIKLALQEQQLSMTIEAQATLKAAQS